MANPTMVLIGSPIVATGVETSINFTAIPQTYTDLKLVCSTRFTAQIEWLTLTINSSTANIAGRYLYGPGTGSAASGTIAAGGLLTPSVPSGWTGSTFSSNEFYIPNYTSTNNKPIAIDGVNEQNATGADIMLSAVLWSGTSAITSVGVQPTSSFAFAANSTFYLYGINNS
jgi:hypothetical protein